MTRYFAAAAVIVSSLVASGLLLAWLLVPMLGEARIKQAVARETGRTIAFAGRPRISLWPDIAIELRDVELSNPQGMAEGRFAAAETVRLRISGASLWRGAPEIAEIVAGQPRVNLLIDGEGRSNFVFERDDGAPGSAGVAPVVVVDGSVRFLDERSGAALAASDVDVTLARAGLGGAIELGGAFNWNDQRLRLAFYAKSASRLAGQGSPADFTIAGPYLNAAFSGRAALQEGLELAGTVEFRAEPLADLLAWAGHASELTGRLPALSASGALDLSGGAIRLTQGRLALGQTKAQGDVALSFDGSRPRIQANLAIEGIDLAVLVGGPGAGLSEVPIDLAILKSLDATLALTASELVYGDLAAGASRLEARLEDGVLQAALVESEIYGGSASGNMTLDGRGPAAVVTATLEASGIDGGKLDPGLSGTADIDLDLAARGESRQELLARLGGKAHLRLSEGALLGIEVAALLDRAATGVAEGWAEAGGQETPFAVLEASFALEDGIAETRDLTLSGPVAELAGSGSIDLLRRRLDLRVVPRISASDGKPATRTLPVPVVIEGLWSAPKIYPDVAGILENPEQAYALLRRRIEASAAKLDLGPGRAEAAEDAKATP